MEDGLTLRKAMELVERRAKARGDAEEAKLPPDEVQAMERAAELQGWSLGQRTPGVHGIESCATKACGTCGN